MILLECPNCGPRNISEFRYGGEARPRPAPDADKDRWTDYVYLRNNPQDDLKEWWYHRSGCRRWFLAVRHTKTQKIHTTFFWNQGDEVIGES
jgi:heterotetrameric sarcosine oxidase delta subunit